MEIETRRQAQGLGKFKYYTGKPCIRGHIYFRYTASGACCACVSYYARKYNNRLKSSDLISVKVIYHLHPLDKKIVDEVVEGLRLARSHGI